jgi:hypothetical protein
MPKPGFDPDAVDWLEITGDRDSSYPVHHDLAILGWDRDAGTIDLLIRFDDRGGHCQSHRHVCTTSVFVLEGEQHLEELLPDGSRRPKVRPAGVHHLTTGDPHPHMERGGPEGAVVFYSHHSPDGRLYDIVDDDLTVVGTVTIDSLVDLWERR